MTGVARIHVLAAGAKVALEASSAASVVRWPEHHKHDAAPLSGQTYRAVQDLYASLPRVRLPIAQ